jgi:hypothetical protein
MDYEFVIGGRALRLSKEDVLRKMRGFRPGAIHTHAVEIYGTLYPIKPTFANVTGLDLLDFTTNQARRVFKRLGFPVKRLP